VENSTKATVLESREERNGLFLIKGVLIIDSVDSTDASHYECSLVNEEFNKRSDFEISVGSKDSNDYSSMLLYNTSCKRI